MNTTEIPKKLFPSADTVQFRPTGVLCRCPGGICKGLMKRQGQKSKLWRCKTCGQLWELQTDL